MGFRINDFDGHKRCALGEYGRAKPGESRREPSVPAFVAKTNYAWGGTAVAPDRPRSIADGWVSERDQNAPAHLTTTSARSWMLA